jgi:hypothetical protein
MIDPSFDSFANSEVVGIYFDSQELLAVLVASAAVLALSGEPYRDDSLREVFIPNDLVNLTFGVPLLFASAYQKLLIPGALVYQIYSSLIYVVALREYPGWIFFLHLIIMCMSSARFWNVSNGGKIFLLSNETNVRILVPSKYGGAILAFWGVLFSFRAFLRMEIFEFLDTLTPTESAIDMADMLIGVVWTIGGSELFRHSNLQLGLCLLLQASALFFGSLLNLLIRPYIFQESEYNISDAMVVAAITLTVTVPFGRFLAPALKIQEDKA